MRNVVLLFVVGVVVISCAASPAEQAETDKHKPDLPSIQVYNNSGNLVSEIHRHCDGTTLLYVRDDWRSGIAAVPDSPLCVTEK